MRVMVAVTLPSALRVPGAFARGTEHRTQRARTARNQTCKYEHALRTLPLESPTNKPAILGQAS